jgi:hypothetical protein
MLLRQRLDAAVCLGMPAGPLFVKVVVHLSGAAVVISVECGVHRLLGRTVQKAVRVLLEGFV